jgi:hypothetical protein
MFAAEKRKLSKNCHLEFFQNHTSIKYAYIDTKKMRKKDWKNIANSQSYCKKSDFDPPSWIDPPHLAGMAKFYPRFYC